jgi:DNA-binding transcriptional LysR family regulator
MASRLNLRQVEAFKAVMENGTISRAAEMLNISQPAMSKLIAHLEADSGLRLFDRLKGRLAPTDQAMRLYDEVDRIFAGVRQVANAVDAIRREEQGRIAVGVMPALSDSFIQRATSSFLKARPNVFCSVQSLSSQWVVERLVSRKLDVGLVSGGIANPYVILEPLMEHPLVCITPIRHRLASKRQIRIQDLDRVPFVSFPSDTYLGHVIEGFFGKYKIQVQTVLATNVAPTLCEFVAAGIGVSLVHPLMLSGREKRLAIRRFEPDIFFNFQLCRSSESRNGPIVEAFAEASRSAAAEISRSILTEY